MSSQPAIIWFWYYWQCFDQDSLYFYVFFPISFLIGVIILILSSIIVARIFLSFANLFHKPKEGIFDRNKNDKDYCYWSIRAVIKKWPIWLARQFYLPLLETLALKLLGVKSYKFNCANEGWIDCEFVEFGKNVRIGQGSIIMSNMIVGDKLIIKKTILKDNVIVGAHSVVMPGSIIEENTILDSLSLTKIDHRLLKNSIFSGRPAKIKGENIMISNKEGLETLIFSQEMKSREEDENLRTTQKELSVPFHVYILSGWWIVGGSYIIPGILFIFFMYEYLIPQLFTIPFSINVLLKLNTILILLLVPLILVGIYLLHLFFIALFTSAFYRFADYRGPAQGIFDRNLDEQSKALDYYHWRSFLLKYPTFAFIRSPFPWLLKWELNFIGSNIIGKGTVFEECFIHSHLNFGKNCYMGTFAHISNHLVDGVYGSENLTFYGAEIGDNCIFNALMGGMPGLEVGDNATFLPMATTIKYDKIGDNGIYMGFPVRKLKNDEIKDVIIEGDLKDD
ncbi:MAG: hypothetical protein EU539_00525 [Promethearchaeota archaeon]|nr:MAG: hypothetical protein EU539_00525 [Candidatus Lokiarchaeota archaeon]